MAYVKIDENVKFYGLNIGGDKYDEDVDITNCTLTSFANQKYISNNTISAIYTNKDLASNKYIIYKRHPDDQSWQYMAYIDNIGPQGVYDFGIRNEEQISYLVAPKPINQIQGTEYKNLMCPYFLQSNFDQWSLVDCVYDSTYNVYHIDLNDPVYLFDKNINVGAISNNASVIKYETLGKHNKIIQNKQNFASGEFSCLFEDFKDIQNIDILYQIYNLDDSNIKMQIGDVVYSDFLLWLYSTNVEGEAVIKFDDIILFTRNDLTNPENLSRFQNIAFKQFDKYISCLGTKIHDNEIVLYWKQLESNYVLNHNYNAILTWNDFVSNGKTKLLRSPDGGMWIVAVSDASSYETNQQSAQYPTTISFSWIEIVDTCHQIILGW